MTLWWGVPPNLNHDPTKFGGHRHCSSGEIIVLVCHVILQGDVIKVSFDFIGRDHQSELTPPPRLVTIATLVVELQWF